MAPLRTGCATGRCPVRARLAPLRNAKPRNVFLRCGASVFGGSGRYRIPLALRSYLAQQVTYLGE